MGPQLSTPTGRSTPSWCPCSCRCLSLSVSRADHSYQQKHIFTPICFVFDYILQYSFPPHVVTWPWGTWSIPTSETKYSLFIFSVSTSDYCSFYSWSNHDVRLDSTPIMLWMGVLSSLTPSQPRHPHPLNTPFGWEFHGRDILSPN